MHRRALLALLLLPLPALAAEVTGYVESRTQYGRSKVDGLLPTDAVPEWQELLELNVQPRQDYGERGAVVGDLSLFLAAAGHYRALDEDGREVAVGAKDTPSSRPFVSLNELYLRHEFRPELNVLAGKKRVVWGPGLAYNPTDLLNPPKDPTDPALQRAGAYLVQVEVPLERFTFTLLASPAVLEQQNGLPQALLRYPSWDRQDDQWHYLLAARAYALLWDTDLNLMVFHSNRYRDGFEDKTRVGLSASRVFGATEVHVEGLVQRGSARALPVGECLTDRFAAVACGLAQRPFFTTPRLDEQRLRPTVLAGARYQFEDESLFSLEYLFQDEGLTHAEFQDYVNALALARVARRLGVPFEGVPGAAPQQGGGLPQKFAFVPVQRHYLFANFQKPKLRDDWTLGAVLVWSLRDLSGLVSPSVAWSATEWMTLTLSGFVPFGGPDRLAARVPETDERVGEYALAPFDYRALLQVRLFY